MANFNNNDMYLVLKPVEGKKETIKNELETYFTGLVNKASDESVKTKLENRKEIEYEGLLIYVVSDNNDAVYEAIISSKAALYGMTMNIDDESLEQVFKIKPEDLEEYLIAIPAMNVRTNSYFIVKPKADKEDTVKEALEAYMKNLETQMENYLADQYSLIEERLEKEYGGYYIYIISNDNEKVYNEIVG